MNRPESNDTSSGIRTLRRVGKARAPHGKPPRQFKRVVLRVLAKVITARKAVNPFFQTLHTLLDRHTHLTLGRLLEEAGEQVWGLTVLLLALLTFIPGVANVLSLATFVVGLQMMWGSPHPWLPGMLKTLEIHKGRVKELLAKIEVRIAWLAKRPRTRRPPSQPFIGFLVAWLAFLAALPIPLPFANVIPALGLVFLGVALLEEWPALAWLGALGALATTIYFGVSFDLAWKAMKAMLRGVLG